MLALFCGQWVWSETANAADLPAAHVEFFETKIRPILAEHCYKCHSEESGKSKGDLRLDARDALRQGGASGAAIIPGDPDKSLLIQAVRYTHDDLQMPPEDEGGRLSAERIAALEEWVRMGAPDPRTGGKPHPLDMAAARRHWAFQPVAKPPVPAVKNARWVETPVDAFVLARLEERKLAPSAPADPRTLLRRVTYDLTGLPPTPEEVDAFLRDKDPHAYAKVVDRLLASPRYGERWARFWLDVARYADTRGYLAGNAERRYAFSHTYRDYVIRAFNEDKPFDQFLVEQLAADQLPLGEDKSALAALGFLTLGRRFLNNPNDIIDDRIDVVTRGLMGLTVTCARCHDHKFDPIPTKDYYSLHGVFASSEEPAELPLLGPLVESPAYQEFLRKKAGIEARVKERERAEVETFLSGVRAKTGDYLLGAHDAKKLRPDEKFDVFAGARKLNPEVLKRYQPWLEARARCPDPVLAPWFAFVALSEKEFAAGAQAWLAQWQEARPAAEEGTVTSDRDAPAITREGVPPNPVVLEALLRAEKPIASVQDVAAIYNTIFAGIEKSWRTTVDAAAKAGGPAPTALPDADREAVRQVLYAADAPANVAFETAAEMIRRQLNDKTSGLKREIEALNWTEPGAPLRAMALVDKRKPANSRVFLRGNPANKGPEVPRQFLEVIGGEARRAFTHGSGRLELAREIASPANPLTARVFVNRVWGWHFGAPLVPTPSDFGVRTAEPGQRALLDWLAATFVERGWSVKQLHRLIVLSRAYRQTSDENPRAAAADPDNQLVHRFNRRRLDFEALRDTLLAAAGTIDLRAGGMPDDLTREPFATRRTIYGFIDRQNLPGMFRTFDFPNPDASSAQRFATTVPQQALFMMNSPFAQEQARRMLQRPEVAAAVRDADRVRVLYRLALQRAPDAGETKLALAFVQRPVPPDDARPAISAGWHYGYGAFDPEAERVRDFHPMTVRRDGRITPAETYPDAELGHVSLTATGGHPGRSPQFASIRRWTASAKGSVRIEGTLGHAHANGDGVRGRIVSSERGELAKWTVHHQKVETTLEAVAVSAGETIDFVVDCVANASFDGFTWAPTIAFTPDPEVPEAAARTWSAKADFDRPARAVVSLTRWEELAQVLLLSNELAFID